MTKKTRLIILGIVVLAGLITHVFIFGKLFPYSPVILGFDRRELSRSVIYTQSGGSFDDLENMNGLIPSIEAFHDLKFLVYMKSLLKDTDHDRIFREVYGMEFDHMIQEFRHFLTEND
jgi:hypothetical protein